MIRCYCDNECLTICPDCTLHYSSYRVLTSNIRPGPGGGLGHRRQQRGRHSRHEAAESDPDGAEPGAALRREPPGAPLHGPGRDPARQQRRRHREAAARESHAQVLYLYTSLFYVG